MTERFQKALKLIEEEQYEKSYQIFDELAIEFPKNYTFRYFRSMIDYYYLHKNKMLSYNDMKMLYEKKTKYKLNVLTSLVYLAGELSLNTDMMKYARDVIKYNLDSIDDVTHLLINKLFESDNNADLVEALNLTDSLMTKDADVSFDLYMIQMQILIKLKELARAEECMQNLFTHFPPNGKLYFMKGKLNQLLYKERKEETYYEDALQNYKIALDFDDKLYMVRASIADCYAMKGQFEESFKALDEILNHLEKDTDEEIQYYKVAILMEKLRICEETPQPEIAKNLCKDFLKDNYAWEIAYAYSYLLGVTAKTKEELLESLSWQEKVFQEKHVSALFVEAYTTNNILKRFDENKEKLQEIIASNPDDGLAYYLYGDLLSHINDDYEEVIHYYTLALQFGFLDSDYYLALISSIAEKPKHWYKEIKKNRQVTKETNEAYVIRKNGIRYLYGEDGFKQDFGAAELLLKQSLTLEEKEPCYICTYARCQELMGNESIAWDYYNKAFDLYQNDIRVTCNCCYGFLAHAYLFGIGTKKNETKAMELIQEAIAKDEEYSSSNVILLYGYFCLLKKPGFDPNLAIKYLKKNYPFYRYDISRMMIANAIGKMYHLEEPYNKKAMKKALKNVSKDYKKFYKDNLNSEVIYPYYKNI